MSSQFSQMTHNSAGTPKSAACKLKAQKRFFFLKNQSVLQIMNCKFL